MGILGLQGYLPTFRIPYLGKAFLRKDESSANLMALDRMKHDIDKMAFTNGTQPTMENFSE